MQTARVLIQFPSLTQCVECGHSSPCAKNGPKGHVGCFLVNGKCVDCWTVSDLPAIRDAFAALYN